MQENDTLRSQYAQKVTTDLEKNTEEQERIREEIVSLQERLSGLEHDHELLVGMRAALGEAGVPGPRKAGKKTVTRKATSKTLPKKASSAKKTAGRKAAAGAKTPESGEKTPSLGGLIHQYLSKQSGPLTAREIANALGAEHPHRKISDNNVRTATERLVARSEVARSKQGSTVYYTAAEANSESNTPPAGKETVSAGA
ncbi:hypothetical protein OG705_29380 [Streptomyces sp. NBC_00838]|uniref:hypothetical protein n=1 Tax=Streptomyces sp. NBC_00838 TaxID=2903680 RepID=UPI00386F88F3|nr:hypothetical protein OG705_29380 [Streptomyces sp. NBC_00838]